MAGKYKVLEKIGNSYRIDLPDSIKIYPVFASDRLRKAATEPLPGQEPDPGPMIEVNGEQEWEVEKILAVRMHHRKLQYKVKWIGYDDNPEWYDARNMKFSPHLLRDFHKEYPDHQTHRRTWITGKSAGKATKMPKIGRMITKC
jgi:hypothetical protein